MAQITEVTKHKLLFEQYKLRINQTGINASNSGCLPNLSYYRYYIVTTELNHGLLLSVSVSQFTHNTTTPRQYFTHAAPATCQLFTTRDSESSNQQPKHNLYTQ